MIPERVQNVERMADMPQIKRELIQRMYDFLKDKRRSEVWWQYKGSFIYDSREYEFECDVRMDETMLTYRNMHLSHKTIEVDIEDMEAKGLLN